MYYIAVNADVCTIKLLIYRTILLYLINFLMMQNQGNGIKFEEKSLSPENPVVMNVRTYHEDTVVRMHYHSSLEINYCENAAGFIHVEGCSYPMEENSLFVLQPETLHSYRIQGNGGQITVWHIGLNFLSYVDALALKTDLARTYPYFLHYKKADSHLLEQLYKGPFSSGIQSSSLAMGTIALIYPSDKGLEDLSPRDEFLHRIKDYSEEFYRTPISIDQAADAVHLSRYHFCRKFKEKTGSTYGEYLNNLRLENSLKILNEGYSVSETADRSGFEDPSYFIRKFKKQYLMTPGEYLSQLRRISNS